MDNLFPGFTADAFDFFMMISMNNNKTFFDENKELYESVLKDPLYALATDMEEYMHEIDSSIDTRPHRCVARIRRSTRYRKDLPPYRDHLWISWRDRSSDAYDSAIFTFYFSIDFGSMSCGSGYYNAGPKQMAQMRKKLEQQPERFERIAKKAEAGGFALGGDDYVRIAAPDAMPELCKQYYKKKSFYLSKDLPMEGEFVSPRLPDILKENYDCLKDMYDFITFG